MKRYPGGLLRLYIDGKGFRIARVLRVSVVFPGALYCFFCAGGNYGSYEHGGGTVCPPP
jgi:hypothetical protein